jgi:hypothetical protein
VYVAGCLLSLLAAELLVRPLNQSVFLREREVVLTNDVWRIVLNLDLEPFEDAISTIKTDLMQVELQKQFTPVAELRQIEALLSTLEARMLGFKQVLPRLDSRRGLFNLGAVLRTLFGTAVLADVTSLHNVIDELQANQKDVVHYD